MREFVQRMMPALKRLAILGAAIIFLFFLFDDVIMPRYVQQGETTKVPDVAGRQLDEALKILEEAGLDGKEAEVRPDKEFPEGTVTGQTPAAGSEVKFGRGIYLTVSGGESMTTVPSLRGKSLRDATLTLERFGLKVGEIQYEVSTKFPENTVIEQSIGEGKKIRGGGTVNVVVSQGPSADRVPVPHLVGKSLTESERLLLQAGLKLGNVTLQVNNDMLPNTVIDQYPRSGSFASTGQAVDIFVAQKGEQEGKLEN